MALHTRMALHTIFTHSNGQFRDLDQARRIELKFKSLNSLQLSKLAGLQFPVRRLEGWLRLEMLVIASRQGLPPPQLAGDSAIYLAAAMELLCAEILELAGNTAIDDKRSRITVAHIKAAIEGDEELLALFASDIATASAPLQSMYPTGKDVAAARRAAKRAGISPPPPTRIDWTAHRIATKSPSPTAAEASRVCCTPISTRSSSGSTLTPAWQHQPWSSSPTCCSVASISWWRRLAGKRRGRKKGGWSQPTRSRALSAG